MYICIYVYYKHIYIYICVVVAVAAVVVVAAAVVVVVVAAAAAVVDFDCCVLFVRFCLCCCFIVSVAARNRSYEREPSRVIADSQLAEGFMHGLPSVRAAMIPLRHLACPAKCLRAALGPWPCLHLLSLRVDIEWKASRDNPLLQRGGPDEKHEPKWQAECKARKRMFPRAASSDNSRTMMCTNNLKSIL